MDETFKNMRDFRNISGYRWDFLHFGNQYEVMSDYDVRIFPTAFLIDPEGKMVLSPAPVPMPVFNPTPQGGANHLERTLWQELNSKGLWQEYRRRGLITN